MRKGLRIAGIVLGCLLLLLVLAYFGLEIYLSSGHAKRLVSEQLSTMLGGNVRVTQIDSGMSSTVVHLEILSQEPEATTSTEPLVSTTVRTDVSPLGLAVGNTPRTVTLENPQLNLRFDKDNNLIGRLPEPPSGSGGNQPLPTLHIRGGSAHIRQEGRPDFRISNVDLSITDSGERLQLSGRSDDPLWKVWTLAGEWAKDGSGGAVTLKTEAPVTFNPEMLRSVPFVPAETWEWVVLDGTSPCHLRIAQGADKKLAYRVEMAPTGARLTVPPIGLTTTETSGQVVVEGPRVLLTDVRGRTADGRIRMNADLNFGPTPSQLAFDVAAERLHVPELPTSWGFPGRLREGRLSGEATLTITIHPDDRVQYGGAGKGEIEGARGLGLRGNLDVYLEEKKNQLIFTVESQEALAPPAGPAAPLAALALLLLQPADAKTKPPEKPTEPTYVQANLRLRDVDLEQLIKDLQVSVPIRITGTASLEVTADIPVSDAGTLRAYRVNGTITAPQLGLGDLTLREVKAVITFREGVLALSELSGLVPASADQAAGRFSGSARYGVDPQTDLTAELKLETIPLDQVFRVLPELAGRAAGPVSGSLRLRAPGARLGEVTAYEAEGDIRSPSLTVLGRRAEKLRLTLNLRKGVARIAEASAVLEGLPVSGSAALTLQGQYPFEAQIKTAPTDAVALGRLVPEAQLPFELTGRVAVDATLKGTVEPLTFTSSGKVAARGLTVGGAEVDQVSFAWTTTEEALTLEEIRAVIDQGTLTGTVRYPLRPNAAGAFDVTVTRLDAATLARVADTPVRASGAVSGRLTGTLPAAAEGARRTGTGSVELQAADKFTVGGVLVERMNLNWGLTPDTLTLKALRVEMPGGNLQGSARLPLTEKGDGAVEVTFKDFDLAAITQAVPTVKIPVEGKATGKLEGVIPPTKEGQPRQATASLDLTAPTLRFQGVPVRRVKGKIDYQAGLLTVDLSGILARGTLDLKIPIRLDSAPTPPAGEQPRAPNQSGSIRLLGADLSSLAADLNMPALAPLRGTLSVFVEFNHDPLADGPSGDGRIEFLNLGWGRSADTTIRSVVRLTPEVVELPDLNGRFAEGTLRGRVRYNLKNPARSFYTLTLDGADAGALLAPFGFDVLNTRLSVTTRGNIGRELRGTGTASFSRGKLTSLELAEVRIPFDWSHTLNRGGRLSIRDAGGQAVGGRLTGEATIAWGTTTHVQGRLRFVDLSFRSLLGKFGTSSGLGSGRMNGQFSFGGTNMRSLNDLTGQLTATLGEGPVFDLPVFSQLAQYLVPTTSARGLVQFTEGELRGRLANGQFRVERLAMSGPRAKLYMEGTVGLTGRLDLDVVAQTGQLGVDPRVLRMLGLRIPAIGPIPVGLILEVTSYLSNRVVRATITGTFDHPVVNVNVANLLTEGAVRYFLTPYLPYQ